MWDFFVYVNTPIVLSTWLDAWLYDLWNENQKVMHWALGTDVNSALTLFAGWDDIHTRCGTGIVSGIYGWLDNHGGHSTQHREQLSYQLLILFQYFMYVIMYNVCYSCLAQKV